MSVTTLKPEKIVATALGLLEREITLPALVWRDPVGDFKGAKDDTISVRLPAYAVAQERALRSGAARTKGSLNETKVDLTLDTDVYVDLPITDEELSLDIADFGAQVLNPVTAAMGRKIEDKLLAAMQGATYARTITHTSGTSVAYETIVDARTALNGAQVPMAGRAIVTGSDLEAELLKSDQFVRVDASGSDQTLRESKIGRVAGFDVYSSPALAADEAYAFHKTAYALSNRAPVVPAGAPWGAVGNYNGFSIRLVRVFDADLVEDRLIADSWLGAAVVTDLGHFDVDPATNLSAKFTPQGATPVTGQASAWLNDAARVVRAVKITVA